MKQSRTVLTKIGHPFQVTASHKVRLNEYLKITHTLVDIFLKDHISNFFLNSPQCFVLVVLFKIALEVN